MNKNNSGQGQRHQFRERQEPAGADPDHIDGNAHGGGPWLGAIVVI